MNFCISNEELKKIVSKMDIIKYMKLMSSNNFTIEEKERIKKIYYKNINQNKIRKSKKRKYGEMIKC